MLTRPNPAPETTSSFSVLPDNHFSRTVNPPSRVNTNGPINNGNYFSDHNLPKIRAQNAACEQCNEFGRDVSLVVGSVMLTAILFLIVYGFSKLLGLTCKSKAKPDPEKMKRKKENVHNKKIVIKQADFRRSTQNDLSDEDNSYLAELKEIDRNEGYEQKNSIEPKNILARKGQRIAAASNVNVRQAENKSQLTVAEFKNSSAKSGKDEKIEEDKIVLYEMTTGQNTVYINTGLLGALSEKQQKKLKVTCERGKKIDGDSKYQSGFIFTDEEAKVKWSRKDPRVFGIRVTKHIYELNIFKPRHQTDKIKTFEPELRAKFSAMKKRAS